VKILIVHNILWAHYKAVLFAELHRQLPPGDSLLVVQIARNERSRAGLETADASDAPVYTYPYQLLFDRFTDEIGTVEKTRALLGAVHRCRPDVINLTGYYDPAQLAVLIYARLRRIPVVMQIESTAADQVRSEAREWIKRRILSLCAGFFCFGSQSARYLLDMGVAPARILTRRNAVDNYTLAHAHARALPSRGNMQKVNGLPARNFVFVGRFISVKNLEGLLTAFATARQQTPAGTNWGLILLGDGPLRGALQSQITALHMNESVRFWPGQPWFRVPDVLALTDVLVLPSLSEPWGLVVNEAMVCGMPVIVSTRCGCAVDLVRDGQNGYIIDPDQPAELTNALTRFISGEADMSRMGEVSRALITPYAAEAVAGEMLTGFHRVALERASASA
jgi:glycosyltransferase involved in cell wall biosynthesis